MKITIKQLRRIIREAMQNYPDELRDEQDDAAHYEQMDDPEFQHKMDSEHPSEEALQKLADEATAFIDNEEDVEDAREEFEEELQLKYRIDLEAHEMAQKAWKEAVDWALS